MPLTVAMSCSLLATGCTLTFSLDSRTLSYTNGENGGSGTYWPKKDYIQTKPQIILSPNLYFNLNGDLGIL